MSRNRRGRISPGTSTGFSLLEVLVAFAILAVSLGAVYQAFGIGARNARATEAYTTAVLLAESQLVAAGVETPLFPGATDGTFGRYHWRRSVSPAHTDSDTALSPGRGAVQLYEVTVIVTWGEATGGTPRKVTLRTLRLGEPQS